MPETQLSRYIYSKLRTRRLIGKAQAKVRKETANRREAEAKRLKEEKEGEN